MSKLFKLSLAVSTIAAFAISPNTLAAETVSPGNVPQPNCDIPNSLPSPPNDGMNFVKKDYTISSMANGLGKELQAGEVIYQFIITDYNKYFVPQKRIEVIDKSPFNPDVAFEKGRKYLYAGYYRRKDGTIFSLIKHPALTGHFLVKEDGMVCSDRLARSEYGSSYMLRSGMPQVYQELPLSTVEEETIAARVTVKEADANSVTLTASIRSDFTGKVSKEFKFDLSQGSFEINGLKATIIRQNGQISVYTLNTPNNPLLWAQILTQNQKQ